MIHNFRWLSYLLILCWTSHTHIIVASDNNLEDKVELIDDTSDYYFESASDWDVSGYLKFLVKDTNGEKNVEIDDLSLILSSHINDWLNPFVEAEIFAVPLWNNRQSTSILDGSFIIERLYNDFYPIAGHRLRIGKFLAPVGQWNLIHAAPLVWTIERPQTTSFSFSNYITGFEYGMEINSFSGSRLDFYWQPGTDFNPKPLNSHPREYQQVLGSSLTLSDNLDGHTSIDYQYAQVRNSTEKRSTLSLQKMIYLGKWSLDGQLLYTDISSNDMLLSNWEGGGFIQTRYQINQNLDQYTRIELFHFSESNFTSTRWLVGFRYRFTSFGNINIEYSYLENSSSGNRLLISYNIMFGH